MNAERPPMCAVQTAVETRYDQQRAVPQGFRWRTRLVCTRPTGHLGWHEDETAFIGWSTSTASVEAQAAAVEVTP